MHPFVPQMMALFEGNMSAYGKFNYSGENRADGKVKGSGVTTRGTVTQALWHDHLLGTVQLGIIPINEDSMCKFGAIDIDDYTVDKDKINALIHKHKLPIVYFRSKSGGAHLFMFTTELVNAALIQSRLKEIAAFIGYGNAEIFPKQIQILKERGDIGQWINMPYFDSSKTLRYAVAALNGTKLELNEFLTYVETKMIEPTALKEFKLPVNEDLIQGPPCLQKLTFSGFPDGTRNQGLFNLGVYAQKSDPDNWKKLVGEFNIKYMKPPLAPNEVLTVIGSLEKKEYNYTCKKQPICAHCNATLCKTRKYGIGEGMGLPAMGSLTKLDSNPPLWFVDIEDGGRLELTTEDLQSPTAFQFKCLETLNIMPQIPKRVEWQQIVTNLLSNITIIPVPKDSTPVGMLLLHLEEYCVSRPGDEDPLCLTRGLIWNNAGHHHFRLQDFLMYLDRKKFYDVPKNKILSVMREQGAKPMGVNMSKGRFVNTYRIPYFAKQDKFVPPEQNPDTIPY